MKGLSSRETQKYLDLARARGATIAEYRPVVAEETPAEARQSEKEFQRQVVKLAKSCGWNFIYHTYDSRRSALGFPDLCICRGLRCVFIELKTDTGKPTEAQKEWLDALRCAGQECYLLRPRDWLEIERILS